MNVTVHHQCDIPSTYRCARVSSLFNLDRNADFRIEIDAPLEEKDWQIGLIVGPSGSGKTSLAKRLFPGCLEAGMRPWEPGVPLIEALAPEARFDAVTGALTAVGLGSVPSWVREFRHLSTGEQFRAGLARHLLDRPDIGVIDEFTSTVDRQVARIGSAAFAKAWRKSTGKFVAVTCHRDVIPWLQPDWVMDTRSAEFAWRRLRRVPRIEVDIFETDWRYWPLFEQHHYLKLPKMIAARCYVGFVGAEPVAHLAVSTTPGLVEARCARFVVLPEWQGAGIGMPFLNEICALWRRGYNRYNKPMNALIATSHPGLTRALRRDPKWHQITARLYGQHGGKARERLRKIQKKQCTGGLGGHFRAIQGFRYIED